jgi:multidrug efflux system membrane fusion protein
MSVAPFVSDGAAAARRRSLAGIGSAALLALAAGCAPSAPPPPPPPQVTVARAVSRTVDEADEFTGRVEAVEAVEVRPRVAGAVERVAFAEGGLVRRGDLLFVIDARPYRAALDRAEAEWQRARAAAELARSEVARARALVAQEAASREELDARVGALRANDAAERAARAAVDAARLDLEWTRVRAPIAGRVGRAEVTAGNLVQAGPPAATRLTTVVSLDPVYLAFDSDEQSFLRYTRSAPARAGGVARPAAATAPRGWRDATHEVALALAGDSAFTRTGRLAFVDNQLDPATGTIRARAVFANPDGALTPGLFARVRLTTGARATHTLVRDAAVGTDQDRKFVLVLKPDGTVDYRAVQLGRLVDGLRAVTAGLAPGERVVVNGLQRVRPGARVRAAEEPMAPPAAPGAPAAGAQVAAGRPAER